MPHDDIARTIGTKVRTARKRLSMTRKQLAVAAAVSERYLHELETGEANASIGILVKVAAALGLELPDLIEPRLKPPTSSAVSGGADPLADLLTSMTAAERRGAVAMLETYLKERRRAARGLALLGLRGAGKSTLGHALASRHGLPFVSITREIEGRAGMSVSDLFNLGGPEAYRALENEVIAELTRRKERIVIETAGGIVGNGEALEMILGAYRTVWLKASPEEHLARVAGQGDTRPMRGHPRALDHLRALLAAREPDYARAEATIDTSGRPVEACLTDLERIAEPLLAA